MLRVDVARACVRPRRVDDLPALVDGLALVAAADGYPSRWPEDPADWLRSRDLLSPWVAEREGDLLGQLVLRRPHGDVPVDLWFAATGFGPDRCAVVTRMFVAPAAQGQGLGYSFSLRLGRRPSSATCSHCSMW